MKARNILFGLSVCAVLCACTDNDVTGSGSEQKIFESNKAYMVVNIQDVGGTNSRAYAGSPDEFEYGTADEHDVNDAHFYFYDAEGVYYGEGYDWNGGNVVYGNTIEFESNTVVMLSGVEGKETPRYVVTVLNKPEGFMPGGTLDEMKTLLANESEVGITKDVDGTTYFAMSTTSYEPSDADPENTADTDENGDYIIRKDATYYFATKLVAADFHDEPIDDLNAIENPAPVNIYVERLAAKVTLQVSDELAATATGGLYPITYAGYDHQTGNESDENYYVKLEGWTLNGIAKESYMVKNIKPTTTWNFTADDSWGTNRSWNDPANYRSYWGVSPNYGKSSNYPTSSSGNTDVDEAGNGGNEPLNEYLTYVSLQNPTTIGSDYCEYCGENTNTVDVLRNEYSTAITNILVKATICDGTGNGLSLIRYDGVLFTYEDYEAYALSELKGVDKLNVWYKVADNDYAQIDTTFVDIDDNVDGYIKIVLKSDYQNTTFYEDASGTTELTAEGVQKVLDEWNGYQGSEANGYKGGEMYYNIPIEHLNNTHTPDGTTLHEANYGIVRNHHYVVTITKLEGLGRGIFDPYEVIVPQNESDKYYLATKINILSWKLVEQSVEL